MSDRRTTNASVRRSIRGRFVVCSGWVCSAYSRSDEATLAEPRTERTLLRIAHAVTSRIPRVLLRVHGRDYGHDVPRHLGNRPQLRVHAIALRQQHDWLGPPPLTHDEEEFVENSRRASLREHGAHFGDEDGPRHASQIACNTRGESNDGALSSLRPRAAVTTAWAILLRNCFDAAMKRRSFT